MGTTCFFPRDDVRQEAGMILEVYAEGLRHDILVSNIQEVRYSTRTSVSIRIMKL